LKIQFGNGAAFVVELPAINEETQKPQGLETPELSNGCDQAF